MEVEYDKVIGRRIDDVLAPEVVLVLVGVAGAGDDARQRPVVEHLAALNVPIDLAEKIGKIRDVARCTFIGLP